MIRFLDLSQAYDDLRPEIDAAIARVSASGWYILGPEVDRFEQAFAAYTESREAIGCATGLDALILVLMAMDIGPGDEVLVPAHTFVATWLAVSRVGARPVPVDVDPDTLNMTATGLVEKITRATKVIIPVHLYGIPVDLAPIMEIARQHGLRVVEDAAQAHGARWDGRRVGAQADAACWSFYPAKNLGAMGDGGAVTTNDTALAERIRLLGNYGAVRKYENLEIGMNSRLDPLQAAILAVKLDKLDTWNTHRVRVAQIYLDGLTDTDLTLPHIPAKADPVWHLFVVRTDRREALLSALSDAGIQTQIHYPIAPFDQPCYADLNLSGEDFPVATGAAKQVLSLPIGPHMPLDDAHRVVDTLQRLTRDGQRVGRGA